MTLRLELPVNPDGGQETGAPGAPGAPGQGVPTGGATGTGLVKTANTNYATAWADVATQAELDTFAASLGDVDQIAWGAAFDAAGEATGAPGGDLFAAMLATINGIADLTVAVEQTPHISFEFNAPTTAPGAVGTFVPAVQAGAFNGAVLTSTGTVNEEVTFPVAGLMRSEPGTWTFALSHYTGPDCGIYTIEVLSEGGVEPWNVVGTVDGYAASPAAAQTVLTGIAVAAGNDTVRVRMATKNGSSSSFVGNISALSGTFIFT